MTDRMISALASVGDDDARAVWVYGGYGDPGSYPGRAQSLARMLTPASGRRPAKWVASVVVAVCRGSRVHLDVLPSGRVRVRVEPARYGVGNGPERAREHRCARTRVDVATLPHNGPPWTTTGLFAVGQVVVT